MQMNTLYIIGNGFDLWHELPTSYARFHDYADGKLDMLKLYFCIDAPDWSDFEESLGTYDWKQLYGDYDYTDSSSEDFRPSDTYGLQDELANQGEHIVHSIRECFHEWITTIDVTRASKKMQFEDSDRFLNFNYTSTLQRVYRISDHNVHHIHGRSDTSDDLIFGHLETMEEEPEQDINGDSNRTMFTDAESAAKHPFYALQKPVHDIIEHNQTLFQSYASVTSIIVIGHSLNRIDLPYFQEIARYAVDAKWKVCCYKNEDQHHHSQQLISCGVQQDKIEFCTYADIFNPPTSRQ